MSQSPSTLHRNAAAASTGTIPLLDLTEQYQAMREPILRAVTEVLDSQNLINGPAVEAFEQQVADHSGSGHAVGVSSGTDALLASLMALGVGPGDEVVLPPFTFFASAGAVWQVGATPVFADIEPMTFNLDPEAVASVISQRTKAIMAVHLFGQMAAMDALSDIAERHNLALIEDAAQAIGATQHGRRAGTIGTCSCFSFFPSKNLGAAGDAGMVVTDDADLADCIRSLRSHGATGPYEHQWVGGNFRLDTLQAAYLSVKLSRLDAWSQQRRAHAERYHAQLAGLNEVTPPVVSAGNESIFNQYVIRAAQRDGLKAHLTEHQIGSAVYYPRGLHLQPCFATLEYQRGAMPQTERACDEVLALPVYPELSEAAIERVSETIYQFYRGH
jgi:dTDP-4-amino-4,6-dideoxygalactose transaminase